MGREQLFKRVDASVEKDAELEIQRRIDENKPDMERQTLLRREIEAEQKGGARFGDHVSVLEVCRRPAMAGNPRDEPASWKISVAGIPARRSTWLGCLPSQI